MDLKEIKLNIELALVNIDKILEQENFSAYHDVKKRLNAALSFIDRNEYIETKKQLLFCIRLLMEAPTKDKELGINTLIKIDDSYKLLVKLIN